MIFQSQHDIILHFSDILAILIWKFNNTSCIGIESMQLWEPRVKNCPAFGYQVCSCTPSSYYEMAFKSKQSLLAPQNFCFFKFEYCHHQLGPYTSFSIKALQKARALQVQPIC